MTIATFGLFGTSAHGPVLRRKLSTGTDVDLRKVLAGYDQFVHKATSISFDPDDCEATGQAISELTAALNRYRAVALPILEARDNSGQENLRSSILEEFFQMLLYPLTASVRARYSEAIALGKANSYVSLTFTPRSFSALFENPVPHVHTKDQDFVLGCEVQLTTRIGSGGGGEGSPSSSVEVVVPVVAIECKTYIERNMLDSCAGTAKRLKTAMPYCLYFVAAEYMKMEDAYPELTDIDELFILTRASNADRLRNKANSLPPHELCVDLIIDIYSMVARHLEKIWWSPEDALSRGRVIARP